MAKLQSIKIRSDYAASIYQQVIKESYQTILKGAEQLDEKYRKSITDKIANLKVYFESEKFHTLDQNKINQRWKAILIETLSLYENVKIVNNMSGSSNYEKDVIWEFASEAGFLAWVTLRKISQWKVKITRKEIYGHAAAIIGNKIDSDLLNEVYGMNKKLLSKTHLTKKIQMTLLRQQKTLSFIDELSEFQIHSSEMEIQLRKTRALLKIIGEGMNHKDFIVSNNKEYKITKSGVLDQWIEFSNDKGIIIEITACGDDVVKFKIGDESAADFDIESLIKKILKKNHIHLDKSTKVRGITEKERLSALIEKKLYLALQEKDDNKDIINQNDDESPSSDIKDKDTSEDSLNSDEPNATKNPSDVEEASTNLSKNESGNVDSDVGDDVNQYEVYDGKKDLTARELHLMRLRKQESLPINQKETCEQITKPKELTIREIHLEELAILESQEENTKIDSTNLKGSNSEKLGEPTARELHLERLQKEEKLLKQPPSDKIILKSNINPKELSARDNHLIDLEILELEKEKLLKENEENIKIDSTNLKGSNSEKLREPTARELHLERLQKEENLLKQQHSDKKILKNTDPKKLSARDSHLIDLEILESEKEKLLKKNKFSNKDKSQEKDIEKIKNVTAKNIISEDKYDSIIDNLDVDDDEIAARLEFNKIPQHKKDETLFKKNMTDEDIDNLVINVDESKIKVEESEVEKQMKILLKKEKENEEYKRKLIKDVVVNEDDVQVDEDTVKRYMKILAKEE